MTGRPEDARTWRTIAVWLCPLWWLYRWYVPRFVRHDCNRNRVICHLDFINRLGWLDNWQAS